MTNDADVTPGDVPSARAGSLEPPSGAEPLRELEVRYRGIIDHLPAVVYVDSVRDGEPMMDVSPGVTELLGIPRDAFLSRAYAWADTIHHEDLDRVLALIAEGAPR